MRKNIFLANKKKIRLLVIAIGLALSITACGNKQRVSENASSIEAELTQNTRQIDKVTENNSENQENEDKDLDLEKTSTTKKNDNDSTTTSKKSDNNSATTSKKVDGNNSDDNTRKNVENTTKQSQTKPATNAANETTKAANNVQQPTTKAVQPTTTVANTNSNSIVHASDDVNVAAKKIVAAIITNNMNQEQKVRAIHDYIIKTVRYEISDNYDIYTAKGALINKVAVCQGYALGFKALCDEAGIKCEMVYGTGISAGQSISHAWNVVCVDGQWYQIDTTWDDPIIDIISEEECKKGANLSYAYYLIPDSIMYMDHTAKNPPRVCTSTKYEKTSGYISNANDFSNKVYSAIKAAGKQSSYVVDIQCPKKSTEQYFSGDIFTILNNGVKKYGDGYANKVKYTCGGNGKYDFRRVTFTVNWD